MRTQKAKSRHNMGGGETMVDPSAEAFHGKILTLEA
jgi:hypothetical protein